MKSRAAHRTASPIAEHVRNRRALLGLTLVHVAKVAGCSGVYVHLVERGRSYPRPRVVRGIAKALGERPELLLTLCADAEVRAVREFWGVA